MRKEIEVPQRQGFKAIVAAVLVSLFSLLLDIYAYQGVKTWVSGWRSARRQKIAQRSYLVFFVGVTILFLAAITFATQYLNRFQEWVFSLFLTFLITKLIFIIVLLLGDIVRFFWGILRRLIKLRFSFRQF